MPNWCMTKIITSDYKSLEKYMDNDRFDLNKIVPIPDEVADAMSSNTLQKSIWIALMFMDPDLPGFDGDKMNKDDFDELVYNLEVYTSHPAYLFKNFKYHRPSSNTPINDELYELKKEGDIAIKAFISTHTISALDWMNVNWGVKYNVTETFINNDGISIKTPWNTPYQALVEMSLQNPNTKFVFLYADENKGCDCGAIFMCDGVPDKNYPAVDYSDMAFEIWKQCWSSNNKEDNND